MPDQVGTSQVIRFATFEVDLQAQELRKAGLRLKLSGQPFQVLAILLEQPGVVVTREELQKRLWPDTFVDVDHNLNTAINKIREALGDSAENPALCRDPAAARAIDSSARSNLWRHPRFRSNQISASFLVQGGCSSQRVFWPSLVCCVWSRGGVSMAPGTGLRKSRHELLAPLPFTALPGVETFTGILPGRFANRIRVGRRSRLAAKRALIFMLRALEAKRCCA